MTLLPLTFAAAAPAGPVGRALMGRLCCRPRRMAPPGSGGYAADLDRLAGFPVVLAVGGLGALPAAVIPAVGVDVLRGGVCVPAVPAGLWPFGLSRVASPSRLARLTIPVALKGEGLWPSPAAPSLGSPWGPQAATRHAQQPVTRSTRAHAAGSAFNGHASPQAGRAARSVMPIAALHPAGKQTFALIPPKCPPLRCEGGTWGGCKTGEGPFSHAHHPTHPQPPPCWRGQSPPSAPLRGERGETQARGCIFKSREPRRSRRKARHDDC
jgi:hypothetical protein